MIGMNTEAVHELAVQMATVADRIRALETRLSTRLAATDWVGRDRERFDAQWQGDHVRALREAAGALEDASRLAADNAREQDRASA
ncbi:MULTISPECIES: hypothetical protein [unclassified Nocardioides]|uniref:hypothetical protein n=1 Tax=unclassified Nocardioides TaxID=2615069 RepID=UPI0030148F57